MKLVLTKVTENGRKILLSPRVYKSQLPDLLKQNFYFHNTSILVQYSYILNLYDHLKIGYLWCTASFDVSLHITSMNSQKYVRMVQYYRKIDILLFCPLATTAHCEVDERLIVDCHYIIILCTLYIIRGRSRK